MKRDAIKKMVLEILADQTGVMIGDINEETTLWDDLGFDELDFVEVAMEIEEEVMLTGQDITMGDGEFDDTTWEDAGTVKDLIDLIERKLK